MFVMLCGTTVSLIITSLQKSKCTRISCCGLNCERAIEEVEITRYSPPQSGETEPEPEPPLPASP